MKTDCAYNRCLQISFIIVQILFICLGGVMIGLGVQFTLLEEDVDAIVGDQEILYGAYFIITAGCAVIVLAVFGILGALCDYKINRILLFLYIVLVIVVFVLQTIGGILAFTYREEVLDIVRDGLNDTMPAYGEESNRGDSITDAWDYVQDTLECCGVNNYTDWLDNPNTGNFWPESCCSDNSNSTAIPPCILEDVYEDSCEEALTEYIQENLLIVATIAITFVVAEVIVVLMAICLLCCTDFD